MHLEWMYLIQDVHYNTFECMFLYLDYITCFIVFMHGFSLYAFIYECPM